MLPCKEKNSGVCLLEGYQPETVVDWVDCKFVLGYTGVEPKVTVAGDAPETPGVGITVNGLLKYFVGSYLQRKQQPVNHYVIDSFGPT